MPNATRPEQAWRRPALAIVLAVTLARVAALALSRMELFLDESQYWLWGQEFAFGYYSKPPLIGWLIGAVTWAAGSDAPFWVRLPAPLLHGAAAMLIGAVAARLFGSRAGLVAATGYATLPMVALGSMVISTDTVMYPFLALALLLWVRVLAGEAGGWRALAAGAALGAAFMAKYAAVYYLLCAPLAALLRPEARPRPRDAGLALAAFAAVIAPNILWNAANGAPTFAHTADNAEWAREGARLNLSGLLEFVLAQFAVVGPVVFGGLLWLGLRAHRAGAWRQVLLAFSLPILALISLQALLAKAYANWAVAAYAAGTAAVLPWLTRRWLVASFAVNGALCIALPVAGVMAERLSIGGELAMGRYVGRAAMSRAIIRQARTAGLETIVARDRDVLADLFFTGRDSGLAIRAVPPRGRARNHYEMSFPLRPRTETVLLVADGAQPPACAPGARPLATIAPGRGEYRDQPKTLFAVPGDCWAGR